MARRRRRIAEEGQQPASEVTEPAEEEAEAAPEPAETVECPHCGVPLRAVLTMESHTVRDAQGEERRGEHEVALCRHCGAVVATGEKIQDILERQHIADLAMAQFGLVEDDMTPYLPTEGAKGIKIISGGRGVRLYTRKRGTLVYRLRPERGGR